jgi:hypothetical protein
MRFISAIQETASSFCAAAIARINQYLPEFRRVFATFESCLQCCQATPLVAMC